MTWVAPSNVTPIDRRNIRTANEADIPDVLAWLKTKHTGDTVDGVFITGKDSQNTYYVQQALDGTITREKLIKQTEFDLLKARVTTVEAGSGGGISSVHTDGATITGNGTTQSPLAIGVIAGLVDGLSGIRLHATSTQTVETVHNSDAGGFDAPVLTYTFRAETSISIGQIILHQADFVGRTIRILDSQDGVMGTGTFMLANGLSKVTLSNLVSVGSGTTFKVEMTKGSAPDAYPPLNSYYRVGSLLSGGTLTFIATTGAPNMCPWLTFVAVGASKQVVGPLEIRDLPTGYSDLPSRVTSLETAVVASAHPTIYLSNVPAVTTLYDNTDGQDKQMGGDYATSYTDFGILAGGSDLTFAEIEVSYFLDTGTLTQLKAQVYTADASYNPVALLETALSAERTDHPSGAVFIPINFAASRTIPAGQKLLIRISTVQGLYHRMNHGAFSTPNPVTLNRVTFTVKQNMAGDTSRGDLCGFSLKLGIPAASKNAVGPLDSTDLPANIAGLPNRVSILETTGGTPRLSTIQPARHSFVDGGTSLGKSTGNPASPIGTTKYKAHQTVTISQLQGANYDTDTTFSIVAADNTTVLATGTWTPQGGLGHNLTHIANLSTTVNFVANDIFYVNYYGSSVFNNQGYPRFTPALTNDGAIESVNDGNSGWPDAIVFVNGVTQLKSVQGPLDPSDFPVVSDVGLLLNNSGAIFDNLTGPPRLVRKRPDGTVWYGPVFSTTP